jgi:hypothetical protein
MKIIKAVTCEESIKYIDCWGDGSGSEDRSDKKELDELKKEFAVVTNKYGVESAEFIVDEYYREKEGVQ